MPHDGILQAICEQPGDDTPRLVYADWLDSAGNAPRAEFIRLQCRRARLDADAPEQRILFAREAEFLKQHADEWLAELPRLPGVGWGRRPAFERGFLASAEFGSVAALRKQLATLRATTPLARVVLRNLAPGRPSTELANWEGLAHLRGLALRNSPPANDLILALADASRPLPLESLDLSRPESLEGTGLSPEAIASLAIAPAFSRLRHLDLRGQPWTVETLTAFVRHNNFAGLERLRLSHLWGDLLPHLARGHDFPGLRWLCMDIRVGDLPRQLEPVLEANWVPNLRRLALPQVHHVMTRGRLVQSLFRTPQLRGLRVLDLTMTQLYVIDEVANAVHMPELVFLRLGESFLSPQLLEKLVNSPHFPELRELHIDWWTLEPAHVEVIARRTGMPKLELLAPVHAKPAALRRYREHCPHLPLVVGTNAPSPYMWIERPR